MDKETDQYRDSLKQYNHDVDTDQDDVFNVEGAGRLQVSKTDHWQCGGNEGFSIGIEWGRYGYAGGVLSRAEAARLVKHIQSYLTQ